ncbi:MAG TPA: erythromycin esterase family protein, partial [Anaerolineae bacterium]|nr:erythromycin esterase family protein [Anaerolineae bacterium]
TITPAPDEVVLWFEDNKIDLISTDADAGCDDLEQFQDMVGDARVVMMGDATAGTHETATLKQRLTQCLILNKGFTHMFLDADFNQMLAINEYINTGQGNPNFLLNNLYSWHYNTSEMLDFLTWLQNHNFNNPTSPIAMYGMDVGFTQPLIRNVINYINLVDPDSAPLITELYACYLPYAAQVQNGEYVATIPTYEFGNLPNAEANACLGNLEQVKQHLADNQEAYIAASSREQIAPIIHSAYLIKEQAFGFTLANRAYSQYQETKAYSLAWLLAPEHENKLVVWSLNTLIADEVDTITHHLSNYIDPDEIVNVGFSVYHGQFNSRDLSQPDQYPVTVFDLREPGFNNYENYPHKTGAPYFYVDFRQLSPNSTPAQTLRSSLNLYSSYKMTTRPNNLVYPIFKVADAFDIMFHIEHSTPTTYIGTLP